MDIHLGKIFALVSVLALSNVSYGQVWKYTYSGGPLLIDESTDYSGFPDTFPGYSGDILIDENALPGGTLVNATVSFVAIAAYFEHEDYTINTPFGLLDNASQVDGLLAFDIHEFPAIEAFFNFTTDENRQIVSWESDFLAGPPDGGISSEKGDYYRIGGDGPDVYWYSEGAGSWSRPHAVPEISASGSGLALGLLAGLMMLMRERKAGRNRRR
ncbi:hypothetical protein [Ketobacter sp.]|uniref:hypothetical protein n=1 Tax=Ketobacter sp. TaxID=2083498 RepID=UPI000F271B6A|nr:hypothetical protein [Ketobacter sp.]RLU01211.1 MAG: hypothetical protein D9N14_03370 [Ketobacter sp.]